MLCENCFCLYYEDEKCILEEIELDICGNCKSCIYIDITEKELAKTDARDRKTIEKIKRRLYAKGYSIYDINDYFYALGGEDEI